MEPMAPVERRAVIGRAIPLLLLAASLSCSAADPKSESSASRRVQPVMLLDSVALSEAGVIASQRLAQHFADGQGFSSVTLEARADWFTDSLVALLRADMNDARGDLGYINFDPFTAAQDDAASFRLLRTRASGDTAYAEFAILFGGAAGSGDNPHHITLAMVRGRQRWQIADLISDAGSISAGIRAFRLSVAPAGP